MSSGIESAIIIAIVLFSCVGALLFFMWGIAAIEKWEDTK